MDETRLPMVKSDETAAKKRRKKGVGKVTELVWHDSGRRWVGPVEKGLE